MVIAIKIIDNEWKKPQLYLCFVTWQRALAALAAEALRGNASDTHLPHRPYPPFPFFRTTAAIAPITVRRNEGRASCGQTAAAHYLREY